MRMFFEEHPRAWLLPSRWTELNRLSVEALHSEKDFLVNNGVNYKDEVSMIQVHRGAGLMVTDHLNEAEDIVNGAFGFVVSSSRD